MVDHNCTGNLYELEQQHGISLELIRELEMITIWSGRKYYSSSSSSYLFLGSIDIRASVCLCGERYLLVIVDCLCVLLKLYYSQSNGNMSCTDSMNNSLESREQQQFTSSFYEYISYTRLWVFPVNEPKNQPNRPSNSVTLSIPGIANGAPKNQKTMTINRKINFPIHPIELQKYLTLPHPRPRGSKKWAKVDTPKYLPGG